LPVSGRKEIAVLPSEQRSLTASRTPKGRGTLAGFVVLSALSVLFWIAIIGGVYWIMRA